MSPGPARVRCVSCSVFCVPGRATSCFLGYVLPSSGAQSHQLSVNTRQDRTRHSTLVSRRVAHTYTEQTLSGTRSTPKCIGARPAARRTLRSSVLTEADSFQWDRVAALVEQQQVGQR